MSAVKELERIPNAVGIPPVTLLRMMETHSPAMRDDASYAADCAWFRTHPKRSATIRTGMEFAEFIVALSSNPAPQLHVLVVQLAPGFHIVMPVWRGAATWKQEHVSASAYALVADDGAVYTLVEQCVRSRGMDVFGLLAYQQHQKKAIEAAELMQHDAANGSRKVH